MGKMSKLTLLIRTEKKLFKGSGLKPGYKRPHDSAIAFMCEGIERSRLGRGVKRLSRNASTQQMRDSYEYKPAW